MSFDTRVAGLPDCVNMVSPWSASRTICQLLREDPDLSDAVAGGEQSSRD